MAWELWFFGALAVGLGVKHAFDADHLVAVSGLLTRSDQIGRTVGLASAWAAGHMVTAAAVSAALFWMAGTLLPRVLSGMELLVPIMLLVVGAVGLAVEFRRFHVHRHAHGDRHHTHFHVHARRRSHEHGAMAGIGVVHGLASNDELLVVLLVGLAADAWWQVLAGVGLFSLGVVAGMVAYAASVHLVSRKTGVQWVPAALTVVFSVASIVYAVYLLGGGEGLNVLERFRAG